MKVMNANGTYSHYKHALSELGYLSTMPIDNLIRVKRNCIMNIRHAYGISSADKLLNQAGQACELRTSSTRHY